MDDDVETLANRLAQTTARLEAEAAERERAEKEVRELNADLERALSRVLHFSAELEMLLDRVNIGSVMTDEAGTVTYVSTAAQRLIGDREGQI